MKYQNRIVNNGDRLPTRKEGEDADLRVVQHKGKFYLAVKVRNDWRYFQETKIAEV